MKISIIIIYVLLTIFLIACRENYTPKQPGYIKVDYPDKKYITYDSHPSFIFEYPQYAVITPDSTGRNNNEWFNISIPSLKGTIHLSYSRLKNNLATFIEDTRGLAYKHTIKASAIDEILIRYPEKKVYGIYYDIKGNTASSVQFFLTDSLNHFIRGSLYFYAQPNQDSLAPVISFIKKDIDHIINTFEWKQIE